jgi:arylsulfatase
VRSAAASPVDRPAAVSSPNILLVMTDQQQAASLAAYGNTVTRTPAIDALCADGVVVDGGVVTYPACTPARATVHTGRYPHTTGARANHIFLSPSEISLPQVLAAHGYETALVGKNHTFPDGRPSTAFRVGALALRDWPTDPRDVAGLGADAGAGDLRGLFDTWIGADHFGPDTPDHADVRAFSLTPELWRNAAGSAVSPFPFERTSSGFLGDHAASWVRSRGDAERPWFIWLSFPDPHNPYVAAEPFASMYDPADVHLPPVDSLEGKPERQRIASRMCGMHAPDEAVTRAAIAREYAMISGIDAALGQVLDALAETGRRERTIVVFLTDHGGYLGEHGAWHKAPAFYDCLIKMPLIVSWPGTLAPGRLEHGFVEQVDIMPTLLDLAGVPAPPGVQGASMAGPLGSLSAGRDIAFAEVGEKGAPVTWSDLPFLPDSPLDPRWFTWDGFLETWIGQGKMALTADRKYVWWANGEAELYDRQADPDELVNLAADPAQAATIATLKDELLAWTVASEDQLPEHAMNIRLADAAEGRLPW